MEGKNKKVKNAPMRIRTFVRGLTEPKHGDEIAEILNAETRLPQVSPGEVFSTVSKMRREMGQDIVVTTEGGYLDGLFALGMTKARRV